MKLKEFTKLSIKFTKNYFFKYPLFVIHYGLARTQKRYVVEAHFLSKEMFFKEVKQGKSIIRLGDGEMGLLHGKDIHYQKHSYTLEQGLKTIIKEYSSTSSYILSIPLFVNHTNTQLATIKGKLSCWLPLKVEFRRMFNHNAQYADAHFFYHKDLMNEFFDIFLKNKHVVFISNTETNTSIQLSDISKKGYPSPTYIDTLKEQSFEDIENIIKKIDLSIQKKNLDRTKTVLVISTGPTSKILAYHYAHKGYQSFDIGFGVRYIYDEKDYSQAI